MGLLTRQKHCKSGTDSMPKCILIANFKETHRMKVKMAMTPKDEYAPFS